MKVGFIGAGNMGGAILKGAITKKTLKAEDINVVVRHKEKAESLKAEFGVNVFEDICELTSASDILFIGVKPYNFEEVMPQIKQGLSADCTCNAKETLDDGKSLKLIVSMAAGITIDYMEKALGSEQKIIRIMPNTPILVGEGMVSLTRNRNVTDEEVKIIERTFDGLGTVSEVSEEMIHCVIGVSGSSPAYTYMYIDGLAKAAQANGMDRQQALEFAAKSVIGAARMVMETGEEPDELCRKVCSPGGTTIEGVHYFEECDFKGIVGEGFQRVVDKSKKMSE